MCACCSPAALRETPPAPPAPLLRYPAVNRLQLKLKAKNITLWFVFLKTFFIKTVTEYNEDGFLRDLLQESRQDHGCSYFANDDGTKVDSN